MSIPFIKMHGCGNDFVIIDARDNALISCDNSEFLTKVADRRFGVGCDQVIILRPHASAEVEMLIRNIDGSDGMMCGNATRCVASLLMEETGKPRIVIMASNRRLECWRADNGLVTVDMGAPVLDWKSIPLNAEVDTLSVYIGFGLPDACCVSMGNPHAVFFVDDADAINLTNLGPEIETFRTFPQKTNVEMAHVIDEQTIRMRVWERGSGITLACGSAACATAVAAVRRGLTKRKMTIRMDGGDLILEWRKDDDHVLMTGPVATVFKGELAFA